ncbi:unnamed protein product [Linum tenue]|uniref:Uncharacterized protein n=1 Tax=Linum tenue TaxID=586396 RepID=A0AAV0KSB5_9ROSI|nr:unnamed protein product [Linum tenue]
MDGKGEEEEDEDHVHQSSGLAPSTPFQGGQVDHCGRGNKLHQDPPPNPPSPREAEARKTPRTPKPRQRAVCSFSDHHITSRNTTTTICSSSRSILYEPSAVDDHYKYSTVRFPDVVFSQRGAQHVGGRCPNLYLFGEEARAACYHLAYTGEARLGCCLCSYLLGPPSLHLHDSRPCEYCMC